MRQYTKVMTIGAAAFVLALGGTLQAQVPARPGRPVQPVQPVQPVRPGAVAPVAVWPADQFHTQQLITHALCMTINGCELQCAAHRLSSGREQERDKDKDKDKDKRGDDRTGASSSHQQTVQQLRQLSSRECESGSQMLRTANSTLGAEVNAPADSPSAWSRRLYTAANQYATTLRSLSGAGEKGSSESSGGSGSSEKGHLGHMEGAQVCLINEALREAIGAFELSKTNQQQMIGNRAVAMPAAAQQLQAHAREMATNSQQLIREVETIVNPSGNQEKQGDKDKGEATVQTLAQQAQMIIDTLQRINPIVAASAPAATAPGAAPAATPLPRR